MRLVRVAASQAGRRTKCANAQRSTSCSTIFVKRFMRFTMRKSVRVGTLASMMLAIVFAARKQVSRVMNYTRQQTA